MLDLTNVHWESDNFAQASLGGCCLKAVSKDSLVYYKLSSYSGSNGFISYESVYEVIVSNLCDLLGIPHIRYFGDLAKVTLDGMTMITYVCWSYNYLPKGLGKLSYDIFCTIHGFNKREPYNNFHKFGLDTLFSYYNLLDFLIINRDRHGGNVEFIIWNNKKCLVEPFDNGLSLLAPCGFDIDMVSKFEPMADYKVNSCLLTDMSLYSGLSNIKKPVLIRGIKRADLYSLFTENMLEVLPNSIYIEKCIDIIWERYCYARDKKIFNTR